MHRRTNPKTFSTARELRHNPTEAEVKLWQVLRKHCLQNLHFRRQHAIGPYIVDFCALRIKLIIELDGEPHIEQKEYDTERTAYLESKGCRVFRFWNSDVIKDIGGVLNTIHKIVEKNID